MDPNLFHIDWERTLEAVVGIIVLAFLVERVTALIVETRLFVGSTKIPDPGSDDEKRETQYALDALTILRADGDVEKIREVAATLTSRHPMWPPAEDGANYTAEMEQRAHELIRMMEKRNARRQSWTRLPLKEVLAFLVAGGICKWFDFDAFAIILLTKDTSWWGPWLTGAVVAGGSKAAIKLFQDLLGVRSMAMQENRGPTKKEQRERTAGGRAS